MACRQPPAPPLWLRPLHALQGAHVGVFGSGAIDFNPWAVDDGDLDTVMTKLPECHTR